MFLVEKDSYIESKVVLTNNITNLVTTGSITNLIDTDRHKFETFADALWWGIVCTHSFSIFLVLIKIFFFLKIISRSHCAP
jgi:hypothetical protein